MTVPLPSEDPFKELANDVHIYKRRWYILFLFFNSYAANNMQWVQYSAIANIIQVYYNVTPSQVDWLTNIYYLIFVVAVFPMSWFFKKMGLRWISLFGIWGTAIGAWIKVLSCSPDLYYVTFIGQTIAAIAQCAIFGMNSEVAGSWFPTSQVATADIIACLGSTLGATVSFAISPVLVFSDPNLSSSDINDTTTQLRTLFYITAGYSTVVAILMTIYFPRKPPKTPCFSTAVAEHVRAQTDYKRSMKALILNKNYVLYFIVYSVASGVYGAISALINSIVLNKFDNATREAGIAGTLSNVFGFILAPFFGYLVDKTHKYKIISLVLLMGMVLSTLAFAFAVHFQNVICVYVSVAIQGALNIAWYTSGYDYGVEISYPEPAGLTGMVLSAGFSLMSWIFVLISRPLLTHYGSLACNFFYVACYVFGFIIACFINPVLKRRLMDENKNKEVNRTKGDVEDTLALPSPGQWNSAFDKTE